MKLLLFILSHVLFNLRCISRGSLIPVNGNKYIRHLVMAFEFTTRQCSPTLPLHLHVHLFTINGRLPSSFSEVLCVYCHYIYLPVTLIESLSMQEISVSSYLDHPNICFFVAFINLSSAVAHPWNYCFLLKKTMMKNSMAVAFPGYIRQSQVVCFLHELLSVLIILLLMIGNTAIILGLTSRISPVLISYFITYELISSFIT